MTLTQFHCHCMFHFKSDKQPFLKQIHKSQTVNMILNKEVHYEKQCTFLCLLLGQM